MRRCPVIALAAALIAPPCALADVELLAVSSGFDHFGYASAGGTIVALFEPSPPAPPISFDNGLLAFSASSSVTSSLAASPGGWTLSISASHTVTASVAASVTDGYAEAGAGLVYIGISLRVTDDPVVYTGPEPLLTIDGPNFASGDTIPPGDYFFVRHTGPFATDAFTTATTGQSTGGTFAGDSLTYLFTSIGAPCPADWDDNDAVNSNDISSYLTAWLDSIQNGNLIADFNGDMTVNSNDISAFLTAWLDAVQNGC